MDCAKAIAALNAHPNKTVAQLQGLLKVHKKVVHFWAVPTTSGTGSETTVAAVITDAPAVPSAEGYFEDLEKKLNNNIFFSQVFSGTDRDSETGAYMQADFQAALYAEQNRKTANEKYEEIIKEINTKDIGAGDFKCTFVTIW